MISTEVEMEKALMETSGLFFGFKYKNHKTLALVAKDMHWRYLCQPIM